MRKSKRFVEIDWLRGGACLFVVMFHYFSQGPRSDWMTDANFPIVDIFAAYGYLGVHLFFMISGFVILLSAEGATTRSFLASRIARLYPAFWVSVSITTIALWFSDDARFSISITDYLVNLTMLAHWFNVPYVDGAYWSLAVELHFYFYVLIAIRMGWHYRIDWLLGLWLLISAVNALRPIWPLEFWLNAKWAPFFVAGGIFYLIRERGISLSRLGLLVISYGLAILYAFREAENLSVRLPLQPEVVTVIITGFFVIFLLIVFKIWEMQSSIFASWLGLMTYPVYLLHQNFGYVMYETLHNAALSPSLALASTFTIVLSLAWGTHHWIELKMGPWLKQILKH